MASVFRLQLSRSIPCPRTTPLYTCIAHTTRPFITTPFLRQGDLKLPKPPPLRSLETPKCMSAAQKWVDDFSRPNVEIERGMVSLSFSRSSGPGGQNVNKVNTKATVEVPIDAWWIPQWAKPWLMKDSHYVASSGRIQISSTIYRSQAENVNYCLARLRDLVLACAKTPIKKEASAEQKLKVKKHIDAFARQQKEQKQNRSSVKQWRKGGAGRGGYFD